jgi:hypothetical protein
MLLSNLHSEKMGGAWVPMHTQMVLQVERFETEWIDASQSIEIAKDVRSAYLVECLHFVLRRIENATPSSFFPTIMVLTDSQLLSSAHQHTYFGASRCNINQLIGRSAISQPHLLQMDSFQRLGITSRLIRLDTPSGCLHRSPLRTICRTTTLVSVPDGWYKATCAPLT